MREEKARRLMRNCFKAGVRAVHPESCMWDHLPKAPGTGRIILLAGGKAAGAMMKVAVQHYLKSVDKQRISGIAVHHHDGNCPVFHMEQIRAGHPVPDENSQIGAMRVLELAHAAEPGDLVVVLLSGGASALWSAPVDGVLLVQKQQLTRDLLRSGASITEINCVRKHLSRIKGGRLAKAVAPARLVTLAISDVVGDEPSVIASGPTSGDPSSLAEARKILSCYNIGPAKAIERALDDENNETPFPEDRLFKTAEWSCVANGASALIAACERLQRHGIKVINLGDAVEGEARDVARQHAQLVSQQTKGEAPVVLLSGGELTVTIKGNGAGGPNQEYALALAMELGKTVGGLDGVYGLAADTDGCDGGTGKSTDPAGAMIFPSTLARARAQKLNPATFLADNNSGTFFKRLDDLLISGPTYTNVNDFRLVLIENAEKSLAISNR